MNIKLFTLVIFGLGFISLSRAQLRIGSSQSEINFREGPGLNFKVLQTINNSNLLIVLPRDPQNGFIEAFDVETSSRGYIYESLINITDTLFFSPQKFFELSDSANTAGIEISLANRTGHSLFVWINKVAYNLSPYEKKVLVLDTEEIIYFSSAPGLFPVFGKELLKKGNAYNWNFSL